MRSITVLVLANLGIACLLTGCGSGGSSTSTSSLYTEYDATTFEGSQVTVNRTLQVLASGAVSGGVTYTTFTQPVRSASYSIAGTLDSQGNAVFTLNGTGTTTGSLKETGVLTLTSSHLTGVLSVSDAASSTNLGTDQYQMTNGSAATP